MHAFSVPRTVTVHDAHGQRRLTAARGLDAAGGLDPACVVLAIHDSDACARRALETLPSNPAGPAEAMRIFTEADLAGWPGWPMRLGRPDPNAPGAAAAMAEPMPLPDQLAVLRARHPGRRHFRIALVGGFGYNLGDTLLGATAWRLALPVLRATLPEVSADVLLGPLAGQACGGLISHEPGIARVDFRPPTLQDFSRYDAYFDFTGLIGLPRFHQGAALDWILWWLGLDPATVPDAEKRNRLSLPEDALFWARERLSTVPGPRVLFVWRASTPLRSIPDDAAGRLAQDLLDLVPGLTLVTEQSLGLAHPRLLDLGSEATSAERMMALVACADGLVSIDSLALHVADAADVPCLLLLNSLPPGRFPYYPNTRIEVPDGMAALAGWGATKLSDEEWANAHDAYGQAWAAVSAGSVWAGLAERMAFRSPPERRGMVLARPSTTPACAALPEPGSAFPHDRPSSLDAWFDAEIQRFAAVVLRPGATAVMACGGPALALARQVSPAGALHLMEPRRLRAQKIAAEAQAVGLTTLHLWPALAGEGDGRIEIPDFDPGGEADPGAWGNLARTKPAQVMRLDALALDECQLLVLRSPQEPVAALMGAAALLDACRSLIVTGPIAQASLPALRNVLAARRYIGWVNWPDRANVDAALLIAAPSEVEARFEGFTVL
jgi:hypothetical protein